MKEKALEALRKYWGYPSFRPGQDEVVEAALSDDDVLAVLPTGGGKSICFQVPAVVRGGLTIVISPLIALMQDQVDALNAIGVRATYINSTLSRREIEQRWTDIEFGRYRLLYLAPERLSSDEFVARANRFDIRSVAVDEAHCISEWGHHFRPDYRQIAEALEHIGRPPVIAVTATATPEVRADIIEQLRLRQPRIFVRGFDRPNITWSVFQTADRKGQILRVLNAVPGTGIIYGPTRRSVNQWAKWLRAENVSAAAYHGGMSADQRSKVQEAWISNDIRVIAATNAFGMGIDKPDVRFVIHDGIPASVEAYYQEAGRGGRDGDRKGQILRVLNAVPGTGIIYGPTRRSVNQWAKWLRAENVSAAAYHGGMSADQRSKVQEAWISNDIRVIAATNAFGMGIDKPDVRFVIHDGIPASVEAYYQEAGRGGRDGDRSFAVLLYQPSDRHVQQRLIDSAHPTRNSIRKVYDTITSMEQIAVGSFSGDPIVVDLALVSKVTGLPRSQIETSIDAIEREGLWSRLPTKENLGFVRFISSPKELRRAALKSSRSLRGFIEGIMRSVDSTAYSDWYALDLGIPARTIGMDVERISRGLAFLGERGLLRWSAPNNSLRLTQLQPRPARVRVDVDALKRSRKHAESKLEQMVLYAEGTRCRRQHLLQYFGEQSPAKCGNCDVCLGRHDASPVTPEDEDALKLVISRIAQGKTITELIRRRTFREEEVNQLLDWLERRRLVEEDPASDSGYLLTAAGKAWIDQDPV